MHTSRITCLALALLPFDPVPLTRATSEAVPLLVEEARVNASCGGGHPCIEVVLRNHGSAPVMAWAITFEVRRPDGSFSVHQETQDRIESAHLEPPIAPGQATTLQSLTVVAAGATVVNRRVVAVVDDSDRGFGDETELALIFSRRGQRLTREELWDRELAVLQAASDLDAALVELDRRLATAWARDICRGTCGLIRRQLDPEFAATSRQPRLTVLANLRAQTSARVARLQVHLTQRF